MSNKIKSMTNIILLSVTQSFVYYYLVGTACIEYKIIVLVIFILRLFLLKKWQYPLQHTLVKDFSPKVYSMQAEP